MTATLITGPARSGKTAALRERYLAWLRDGVRTDQILVLTHGAGQTAPWLRGLDLPAGGPIEAHDFYGFVRAELTLHWPTIQAALPAPGSGSRPRSCRSPWSGTCSRCCWSPTTPSSATW
jgi:hypothetical protein